MVVAENDFIITEYLSEHLKETFLVLCFKMKFSMLLQSRGFMKFHRQSRTQVRERKRHVHVCVSVCTQSRS